MTLTSILNIVLVAFAFGFVIFWHELGHFLAARWAGVRVEQFAVGMGNAIFSWRKGIGFRPGNTQTEFDQRIDSEIARRKANLPAAEQDREWSFAQRYEVAQEIGLGQTDYRFNWIPIGGYVKPTGQDDLRPAKEVTGDDPHSYAAKSVFKRMVIISAGVVMNIILAFALYVALFLHGFKAPPAMVGQVVAGSPAQKAGLKSGDEILALNGWEQQNYPNFTMDVALLRHDQPADFLVRRVGLDKPINVSVTPIKRADEGGLPVVGITSAMMLGRQDDAADPVELVAPEMNAMPNGSTVVAVGGQDVSHDVDAHVLTDAINAAAGNAVDVTIRNADGSTHRYSVRPVVASSLLDPTIAFAGLEPRVVIGALVKDAPAQKAGLLPGDVVAQLAIVGSGESLASPAYGPFMKTLAAAVKDRRKVRLTVERDGRAIAPIEIDPATSTVRSHPGIGVLPEVDLGRPVIASVLPDSVAEKSGLKTGETITAIAGKPVANWADVIAALRQAHGDVSVTVQSDTGERSHTLSIDDASHTQLAELIFEANLPLSPLQTIRQTNNPLVAAKWGIAETRAKLVQVYVTLRRVIEGDVPLSNMSGPLGIFAAGKSAASRGIDWLIWFTALISANLAVVNFLPIPIVDGGLFTFLCIEKITGRPPSPKVQATAQIVGIVLLGSLFLFVTYHDILRQLG